MSFFNVSNHIYLSNHFSGFTGEKYDQILNLPFQLKLESVQNNQVLSIPRTLLALWIRELQTIKSEFLLKTVMLPIMFKLILWILKVEKQIRSKFNIKDAFSFQKMNTNCAHFFQEIKNGVYRCQLRYFY